jgi:hypothetical protein
MMHQSSVGASKGAAVAVAFLCIAGTASADGDEDCALHATRTRCHIRSICVHHDPLIAASDSPGFCRPCF